MQRRDFIKALGLTTLNCVSSRLSFAVAPTPGYANLLVLLELKGGNDGLNTVIPYADSEYYALRPRIAIPREQVLQLDQTTALHPSLQALLPLWQNDELAIVQGLGYPRPNLSHFRSIEIWDTASNSDQYLAEGWLTRAFDAAPTPRNFAADGIIVGGYDFGPLSGGATRAIALSNTEQFLRQAKLAAPVAHTGNAALLHILKVERDIAQAAANLNTHHAFSAEFPKGEFGNALKTASQVIAAQAGVAAIKVSLNGFDTHSGQPGRQGVLLKDLAEGLAAFRAALVEIGRWDSTLIISYAEFGRRARENKSNGTDHGTANAHFVIGGRVKGGLYGHRPQLRQLDGNGNLAFAIDFRSLYATAIEKWWGVSAVSALGGRFPALELIKT